MKTTLDLPDSLMKQVKLRALRDGRKLKDAVAELLRAGLTAQAASGQRKLAQPVIAKDRKTGLPVISCRHPAPRGEELTPDRVAEILSGQ
jgi:plasmid stability protein